MMVASKIYMSTPATYKCAVISANVTKHANALVHYHQKDASATDMVFMQVDGAVVDLRARPYELPAAPGGVGLITLN